MSRAKKINFEKVVEYSYPDGTKCYSLEEYYFLNFLAFLGWWFINILKGFFYPFFVIFDKKERENYIKSKIYWREIK